MSFQAYLDTIKARTGKSPDDLRALADAKGLSDAGRLKPGIKAAQVIDWLKQDFDLGRGHAMAIYALLSGKQRPTD